ncbi:hypothetical protein EDI_274930 [Entamoeba dispar SAW760]|uniref:Uncharacterized protein n=1 Tax=Entamoeba dispar (strain ATCC PRA-260 / SAW760) TaxID=370354 RepID=B0EJ18_ENTDS|nr:uncharacterized protein EDI_274930 [Entamoeba dispar SAW760]EDR25478.1 hypothetical protein EDI_274930 [Entamoeba dispar SAW760]|eukprot:EDR25478.1 hypothetical protein EDI_274930 [Entamoeba dispar SAW760]
MSKGKYYEFNSSYGFATINYDQNHKILTLNEIKNALQTWTSTKTKPSKIEYLAVSTVTKGDNKHAHVFFKLDETAHSRKRPLINVNNTTYSVFFTAVTEHPEFDGSFMNIIRYLERQAKKHGEEAKFEEFGKRPNTKGRIGGNEIMKALNIPTLKEASAYLQDSSPMWWLNNGKKFRDAWREKHANDKTERIKIKLFPWDENNSLVKNARAWLKIVKSGKVKRTKLLVLLGETRIGKSEFINDLLKDTKVQEFRGRVMFDGKDSLAKYEVRLFDDANLAAMDWFEFKAIVSTNGEKITMNVKYDHADVISLPTIVVLNTENWNLMKEIAKERGDAKWLEENATVLFSKDKLYKQPERRKKSIEELKQIYGDLDPDILSMYSQADDEEVDNEEEYLNSSDSIEEARLLLEQEQPVIDEEPTKRIAVDDHEIYKKFFDVSKNIISQQGKNKYITTQSGKKIKIASRDNSEEEESEDDPEELASRWTGGNF